MKRTVADPDQAHELNISIYSEGDKHFVAGRYRKALRLFKAALDADPSDGDTWHAIGSCYDALGQPNRAAAAYHAAMLLLPPERHPELRFNIGNAHFDLGEYSDALVQYALVPKASSVWPAAAKNRDLALRRMGNRG